MMLAIHLRNELGEHDLIELLPAGTARHLRLEGTGRGQAGRHAPYRGADAR
jgi:hypothetical protein